MLLKHYNSCRWCQRESGASFALHAKIETSRLKLLKGSPEWNKVPSESGAGVEMARCPHCKIALWNVYGGRHHESLINVGTLDNPDACPPDAHIWTSSKQPWLTLSGKIPTYPDETYVLEDVWSKESLERRRKNKEENGIA
jgi:hypothetical protein